MIEHSRRKLLKWSTCACGSALLFSAPASSSSAARHFIAEAERMREMAVKAGDQPYGAVLVNDGVIVGYGPSRVVSDKNPDAHAERVALWDAQRKLGRQDLTGAVIYSTSRPCSACQAALARAKIERMYHGPDGTDGGPPRA